MEDKYDLTDAEGQQPDHITQYEELYQAPEKIIGDLPVQRRCIYMLNHFEGKSHKEIALQLGISHRTAGQPAPFAYPNALGAGTNWMDELLKTGKIQEQQISVSGGGAKNKYFFSLSHFRNDGMMLNTWLDFLIDAFANIPIQQRNLRIDRHSQILPALLNKLLYLRGNKLYVGIL